MTPLPLELSTLLPPKISTVSVSSVYFSIVQQCIFLDSKLGTKPLLPSSADNPKVHLRKAIRPSSIKTTDSSSSMPLNTDQSNSPRTSTGSVSGRLPEIKVHTGPESLSLSSKFSHTLCLEKVAVQSVPPQYQVRPLTVNIW